MSGRRGSITERVVRSSSLVLAISLALVGAATGGALHAQHTRSHDLGLLTAARERANGGSGSWRAEHLPKPDLAWISEEGDPLVPAELRAAALRSERPVFDDVGGYRLALIVAERGSEDGASGEEEGETHVVVAARRPATSVIESVGIFAMVYALFATMIGLVGSLLLRRVLTAALAPVARARDEVSAVVALSDGKRLSTDAPEEVSGLLRDVNALLDRLDASARAQSRFTAEAAHELRTPVTALLGELDVSLRRDRSAEDYRATLESVRDEVGRLRRIVEGLTALARLDAGEVDRRRELVRARELVDEALHAEAAGLASARITTRVELIEDSELEVHRALVVTALSNLLRNAARHAPGAPLTVFVRREDGAAIIDVDDGGPGVPEADRAALFDRFARAGTARARDPEGLGLGLPIAREVARHHGGDCVLLRAPSGGLRARLQLRGPPLSA